MFTWLTLGEGLQAEGATEAKAQRYEQAGGICGKPGIQTEINHGGFCMPQSR